MASINVNYVEAAKRIGEMRKLPKSELQSILEKARNSLPKEIFEEIPQMAYEIYNDPSAFELAHIPYWEDPGADSICAAIVSTISLG